jgi:C1A family cysteine protease
MVKRAYGYCQEKEDHQWLRQNETRFDLHRFKAVRVPASVDPRPHLQIKDQGQLGSCSGASRALLSECLNGIQTGWQNSSLDLSIMYAYLTNQKECGCSGSDDGATVAGSVQAAQKEGICESSLFPYSSAFYNGQYSDQIPAAASQEGVLHLIKSHAVLRSYNDCFAYLATGTGVIQIGIPVTNGFESCTGILTPQMMTGSVLGGHALSIVGYTTRLDKQGRKYLILVNSWGTDWASNGTCEVDPSLFDKWAKDGYSELIGISDLEAYEPQGGGRPDWNNLFGATHQLGDLRRAA